MNEAIDATIYLCYTIKHQMKPEHNKSLKDLNTFAIEVFCTQYIPFYTVSELQNILSSLAITAKPILVIGGGSNILFTKNFDGTVLHNCIKGITVEQPTSNEFLVTAGAGELWHDLVLYCIENNMGGLENLSLIPGCVGASPMQNIGAYGVEIKDVFYSLSAIEIASGKSKIFTLPECQFGYRESIFKHELKGKYIITEVTYKLRSDYKINTNYGAIETELKQLGLTPTIKNISTAVCNIRNSKLPKPKEIGNAGSFFKNPTVTNEIYNSLKLTSPTIPGYAVDNNNTKLAAGWLIEQCGLKGYQQGDAGVHKNQALVLVNYGKSTGLEIYNLSEHVLQTVKQKFGITLEREVNIM